MTNEKYFSQKSCSLKWRQDKDFPNKQKPTVSITTRLALEETLKEVLQAEMKGH